MQRGLSATAEHLVFVLFKVIQGHRVWYQSKAHMGLVINTNLPPYTVSEIKRSVGPKSLYSVTPLVFNSPDGGVPLGLSP